MIKKKREKKFNMKYCFNKKCDGCKKRKECDANDLIFEEKHKDDASNMRYK